MKGILITMIVCLSVPFTAFSNRGKERPKLHLGGALRFNYNFSDWNRGHRNRGGDFGYDVFLLQPTASYKKLLLEADFRFYSTAFGGFMLKYGWIGYQFDPQNRLEIGLTRVPFGIQPSGAHNFFFQIAYYVGLEDDSDMGLKFVHTGKHWEYALAFFKNAEELLFGADTEVSDDRYGYDVAGRNKEINQVNGQLCYTWGAKTKQKTGISAEFGQLYNLDTRDNGTHFALAVHHELYWKGLSLKAQATAYALYPKNAPDECRSLITMTAYGAPYLIAAKANIYSLSLGYKFPLRIGPFKSLQVYNDFGWLQKRKDRFKDSFQNVSGCLLTAGPVLSYIDYALGKNQAWLGPDWDGFGWGEMSSSWHARFNINIGYYF